MIDPRAVVDASAELGMGVSVGPFSVIGPNVQVGEGTEIGSHVVLMGRTRLGARNKIFSFASIGQDCQDKKYQGEDTLLDVGDDNVFREFCTVHRGTVQGGGLTRIGHRNLFMCYAHVAHDCIVGNDVVLANNATLAGHVVVGNDVTIGGLSAVHQFCLIGDHAFVAGASALTKDVPPFVAVSGRFAEPYGINTVGLTRRGFTQTQITSLQRAYKMIYRQGLTVAEAIDQLESLVPECQDVSRLIQFLRTSTRGIAR